MTIQELEKELKVSILEGIYLLYGEETYLLESSLKKMKLRLLVEHLKRSP